MTAADDKFCDIFPNFQKNKVIMIFHENRLPADDSHEISCLISYFWKSSKIWNYRLLQIIGGTLWVKLPVIHSQPDVLGLVLGGDTTVFITQVDLLSGRARDAECHVCCSQLFLVHFLDTHQTYKISEQDDLTLKLIELINRSIQMKKVNKQCLLDTPRTVKVSEKTWQVIVQTRRP